MTGSSALHQRLRAATGASHAALDQQLDIIEQLSLVPNRQMMVRRYYEMHASADRGLAPWLEPIADLEHGARQRSAGIAADLRALGLPVPVPSATVVVASKTEALGFLYVLEGSALGGRLILRALADKGASLTGLGFLDPYGPRTGERWRSFLAILEREGADDPAGVERGGELGFEHARACLAGVKVAA